MFKPAHLLTQGFAIGRFTESRGYAQHGGNPVIGIQG